MTARGKAEVEAARDSEGLTNIRLLDPVPRDWLHASLSLADVHLISMRPEMNGIVVPGKLYGAMAAGRPIVFIGPEHCEPADTIRHAGCGFTLPAGDASALVQSLELLASDPSLARRMGERARTSFIAHYEQRLCCSRWSELIEETLPRLRRSIPQLRPFGGSSTPGVSRAPPAADQRAFRSHPVSTPSVRPVRERSPNPLGGPTMKTNGIHWAAVAVAAFALHPSSSSSPEHRRRGSPRFRPATTAP